MTYLYREYSDLDESDLETIEQNMNSQYDPTEPFSIFINKIEDTVDLAEASGTPCIIEKVVKKDFNIINKAQCYLEGV